MKAAQVSNPGADFQIVEREIPEPGAGHVRIKVQACGVCHSDVLTKDGFWPGIKYPRVPGHEVAGILDEVGASATAASPRVGYLHVNLDDAPWVWMDASGNLIILQGLPPGPHKVLLQLNDANHHPLDQVKVLFVVPGSTEPTTHH
jgi:hypothetical protein